MSEALTLQWLGEFGRCIISLMPSGIVHIYWVVVLTQCIGEPLSTTGGLIIGEVKISNNRANLSLNITNLTTSHAGLYTCQASLINEDVPILLQQSTNITFTCKLVDIFALAHNSIFVLDLKKCSTFCYVTQYHLHSWSSLCKYQQKLCQQEKL